MSKTAQAPFHVMVKPVGPACNLGCRYCFYLEKEAIFPGGHWRMAGGVLENFTRQYIEAQPAGTVTFAWQGGEPTLLGADFFRQAVALQKQFGGGRKIENAFQTNGVLLDDEWGAFLKENNFLVGLSLDGPRNLHDPYRVDKQGGPTFDRVMRGLEVLKKHGVEFNTLTCVQRLNAKKPLEVYRFLRGIGAKFMQFIPVIERSPDAPAKELGLSLAAPPLNDNDGKIIDNKKSQVTAWSVRPEDYGGFLCEIFDRWVRHDVGRIYMQMFDVALGQWLGLPGGLCVQSETCGRALVLEHDGGVYACDHYVYPQFYLGNIKDTPLAEMADSLPQKKFGDGKRDALPEFCRNCDVRFACHGGCPKHRIMPAPGGQPGLNYLCPGYKNFFHHIAPYMGVMANLYRNQQPPAAIMELLARKQMPGLK